MRVSDFLSKYHRECVRCKSFYIQLFSYLKNDFDVVYDCKLFSDEKVNNYNRLYKYRDCKIKAFSIKKYVTCYSRGNNEEFFINLMIYFNPKDLKDTSEVNPEDEILELANKIVL